MIEYIHGILTEKQLTEAVVEAGGVGYLIDIPLSTYEWLPEPGKKVKIVTHHHIREDAEKLFGFATLEDRKVFRALIAISGIGPKVGLNILSKITTADLAAAVAEGNATRLKSVPGIGPKTAQRLVMELRDNASFGLFTESSRRGQTSVKAAGGGESSLRRDAYDAMISLGYPEKAVGPAIDRVAGVVGPEAPIEEWIKKALQVI